MCVILLLKSAMPNNNDMILHFQIIGNDYLCLLKVYSKEWLMMLIPSKGHTLITIFWLPLV